MRLGRCDPSRLGGAVARRHHIPARTIAAPGAILASAWALTVTGELPANLLVSLARVAAGFAIGTLAGLSCLGEDVVDAPMQMPRTLPFLAPAPLFIL